MNTLSSSLKRLGLRLLTIQFLGNAALLLAGTLWLEIPDSHLWQLFISLIFGAAIVAGMLLLHTFVIYRLGGAADSSPVWLGTVLLAGWVALLSLPSRLVDQISSTTDQRASYWNSQLSAPMRTFFTYERLSHWQIVTFDGIVWFLVPVLLLPFMIETISRGVHSKSWRNALRVLTQWKYWVSCVIVGLILHLAVLPLIDWQPGHSVAAEIISVVFRLGLVYVCVILLLTTLLAVTSTLLSQRDGFGDTIVEPAEDHAKPVLLDE